MQALLKDVVSDKGRSVQTTTRDCTVIEAVNQMHRQGIGALLVVANGALEGIITERDVLFRVVNEGLDPVTTTVSEVMTREPFIVTPDTTVTDALGEVTERRIRHLPLLEDGKLVGLVSSGDLTRYVAAHLREEVRELSEDVEAAGFKFKVTAVLVAVFIVLAIVGAMAS